VAPLPLSAMRHSHLYALFCTLILVSCVTVSEKETNDISASPVPMEQPDYKETFFRGEIPATWSYVARGDIGPMPYHDEGWIDLEYINFSFAQYMVSYGDMNWTQADIAFMEGQDLQRWVDHLKNDPNFAQLVQEWTQENIGGRTADVVTFKTEPDGTVSKGGTGGKMYFLAAGSKVPVNFDWIADKGIVISKQSLGNDEFETGFQHFIDTISFDDENKDDYRGIDEEQPSLEVWYEIEMWTPDIPWVAPAVGVTEDDLVIDELHLIPKGSVQTAFITTTVDQAAFEKIFSAPASRDAIDNALRQRGWVRHLSIDADGPMGTMWGYRRADEEGTRFLTLSAICSDEGYDPTVTSCSEWNAMATITAAIAPGSDL